MLTPRISWDKTIAATTSAPRKAGQRHSAAFTLLELLIVVTIVAILGSLIMGTAGYIQRKGAAARAEAEIAALTAALESYKADHGDYPAGGADPQTTTSPASNANLLSALMPSTGKVYFEFTKGMTNGANIVDPFGENYGYCYPGVYNGSSFFDLWSRVGSNNTNVWIKNW